jgi:hypothetical protein
VKPDEIAGLLWIAMVGLLSALAWIVPPLLEMLRANRVGRGHPDNAAGPSIQVYHTRSGAPGKRRTAGPLAGISGVGHGSGKVDSSRPAR